jgi:cytochrome c553
MKKLWLSVVVSLFLMSCAEDEGPAQVQIDIAAGKVIAETSCAGCHGMDGHGITGDIPNLAAQPQNYLVDALTAYTDGRRHHAALADMASSMTDADIRNIAAFYSSLPPIETPGTTDSPDPSQTFYQEGAEVARICTDCHGEHGNSDEPGIPSLAGQQPAYLIVSIQEYARGERGHQEKEAMLQGMEQVDIEKMALYFASQTPKARTAPAFGNPANGEPLSATCGECHGARGISHDPLVPSLAGQEPNYLVSAIEAYRDGSRLHDEMMADRSDSEIEDIAAFYSIQTAAAAADQFAAVQELAAKCNRCHGPDSRQSAMAVPSLNGQNRDYLVRVMQAYRDEDRGNSMMHKMSANYSDETIEAIATYYSGRPAD